MEGKDVPTRTAMWLAYTTYPSLIIHTVILIDVYSLTTAAGQGATFSGFVIGMWMSGAGIGCFAMWAMVKMHPNLWRKHMRCAYVVGAVVQTTGAVLYAASGACVHICSMDLLALTLVLARFLGGFGFGLQVQLSIVAFSHAAPESTRAGLLLLYSITVIVGAGLGPIVNVVQTQTYFWLASMFVKLGDFEELSVPLWMCGAAQVAMVLPQCFLSFQFVPSFEHERDFVEEEYEKDCLQPRQAQVSTGGGNRLMICGGLVVAIVRGFTVSSLEAASSFVLEVGYHWNFQQIGLAIALSFMFIFPIKSADSILSECLSLTSRTRLYMGLTLAGLVGLYFFAERSPFFLIVADCVVFPCVYYSDALLWSQTTLFLEGSGSMFNMNNLSMLRVLLGNGGGRFIGAPAARYQIVTSGMKGYSLMQLAAAAVMYGLFELCMARNLEKPTKEKIARQ